LGFDAHRAQQADFAVTFLDDRREQQRDDDQQSSKLEHCEHGDADQERAHRLLRGGENGVAFDNPDVRKLGDGEFDVVDPRTWGKLQQERGNTAERQIGRACFPVGMIKANTLLRL
jgi:hypothetical protein